MRSITTERALGIINDCAAQYAANLVDRNIMFVLGDANKADTFEVLFTEQNYLHLTGVKTTLKSNTFFSAAISGRLRKTDFIFAKNGTTEMKLDILPSLMNIHSTARMVGDYDNSNELLVTDKFAGTVTAAMGFVKIKTGEYVPNTALKVDVRDVTRKPQQRIVAILRKSRLEHKYTELTYIAKGFTIGDKILQPILDEKADRHALIK